MQLLPLIVSLAILVYFALKDVNIVILSILSVCVLALLSGNSIHTVLNENFLPGMSGYIQNFFLLFLFSVVFGQLMQISGFAYSIANTVTNFFSRKFIILGVVFSCAILVFSGVSALVVVFVMYPIALSIFEKVDLPVELIPASIATGAFTFTTSCFPGSPSISNATCSNAFGTDAMAAPLIGIICGLFSMVASSTYLLYVQKKARNSSRGFIPSENTKKVLEKKNEEQNAPIYLALAPPLSIIISLNVFKVPIEYVMLVGSLVCLITASKKVVPKLKSIMKNSVTNASKSIISTAAVVGFGGAVQASDGFQSIIEWSETLNINPYLSLALVTTLLCGFSGSSTGGLAISTNATAQHYLSMGLAPQALHRIAVIAGNGLDSLPHNGAVNTLLVTCDVSYKDGYKHIFMTTVILDISTMFIAVLLANLLY